MNKKAFTGIMPALITPFDDAGELIRDSVGQLINWQLQKGVRGFYINGSTGEGPVTGEETRRQMAEASVEAAKGRGVVINHIGAPDTHSALRLAKHAAECGCDAISSVVPNFYYGYSDDEIIDYYKMLSDVCPLPLVVYATGLVRSPSVVDFIARVMREVPTAIGVKYTLFNYYDMHRICEIDGGNINVINGPDEMLICGLTMGADGGIGSTYNLMADRYVKLYGQFVSGDAEGARQTQFEINRVITVLIKYGVIASIKEALRMMDFDAGHAALPGKRYSKETAKAFRDELAQAGYTFAR